jgi:hypothetical protein
MEPTHTVTVPPCRPLIIEEFGLTKRFFTLNETKVVVAVVADALIAAKSAGKPLMGAWIWQAAPIGTLGCCCCNTIVDCVWQMLSSSCLHHAG